MELAILSRPKFQLGKIKNKYVIIDILIYAFEDYKQVYSYLFHSSNSMRTLLKENFLTINNMMWSYHIELAITKTFNYKTSMEAHNLLE
jgi:hypothetical protein